MNKLVITRNQGIGKFAIVNSDGSHTPLGFDASMKAGDVAAIMAKAYPNTQIGIETSTFENGGNWMRSQVRSLYGEVVWMKPGFEVGR